MARGYTEVPLRDCGSGAKPILEGVLTAYERRAADGTPRHVGKVRQVYDRSAYVEFSPDALAGTDLLGPPLVLLAGPGFDGPLATVLASGSREFRPAALEEGDPCRLRRAAGAGGGTRYRLSVGGVLDVTIEPNRLSGPTPEPVSGPELREFHAGSSRHARARAVLDQLQTSEVADGLDWLGELDALRSSGSSAGEVDALVDGWVDLLAGGESRTVPPGADLLGRGPGATPSGDDIVSGLILALHRTVSGDQRDRLERAGKRLIHAAEDRTTTVSTALLAQAVHGRAADRVKAALHALLGDEPAGTDWETAVLEATEVGHTSGADLVVGMLLVPLAVGPRFSTPG